MNFSNNELLFESGISNFLIWFLATKHLVFAYVLLMACGAACWSIEKFCKERLCSKLCLIWLICFSLLLPFYSQRQSHCNFNKKIIFYSPYRTVWWTFSYFLVESVNRFMNKVINVLSLVIYCLIFSILHVTFKRH